MNETEVLASVCQMLSAGRPAEAQGVLENEFRFTPVQPVIRKYSDFQALTVFRRDGFVDRYSGQRLVFPGTLRLLSRLLPDAFPFHPNWKMSHTHIAFWQLCPTVDHVVPVARGGPDEISNWVTTSQLRNSAKSNWLLEELGWELYPPGDLAIWDGLAKWFLLHVEADPTLLRHPEINRWCLALRRAAQIESDGARTVPRDVGDSVNRG